MKTFLAVLVAVCLVLAQTASVMKRSSGKEEAEKDSECPGRQPCGWYVYNKSTRYLEFFMNNTCVCPDEKVCEQADDDLSVGAYVYRCLDKIHTIPQ